MNLHATNEVQPMNVELLRQIVAHIQQVPGRLVMRVYLLRKSKDVPYENNVRLMDDLGESLEFPPCGTVGCIAGWAIALSNLHGLNPDYIEMNACRLLRLPSREGSKLFHLINWPDVFYHRYVKALTAEARAEVLKDRVEHFIATRE